MKDIDFCHPSLCFKPLSYSKVVVRRGYGLIPKAIPDTVFDSHFKELLAVECSATESPRGAAHAALTVT